MSLDPHVPGPDPFGPFDPPAMYAIEPEFQPDKPRPIPPELHEGRYARGRRRFFWGFLTAGVLCILSERLPFVATWGLYVLPLQYLDWIGVACIVIAFAGRSMDRLRKGPYRYVIEGTPLVVRVRQVGLQLKVVVNGQPSSYQFVALVEYRDPATQELVTVPTYSNEISAAAKDQLTTSYHAGDYATGVYLPGDLKKTLRLYGFLDLRPELGLIRRDGASEMGLAAMLVLIGLLFGIFGVLGWNLYAFQRYHPLEMTLAQQGPAFAVGAALVGGAMIAFLLKTQARERARRATRNLRAAASGGAIEAEPPQKGWFGIHGLFLGLVIGSGALGLGGLTFLCWCFTANAWLDDSAAAPRAVLIEQVWTTTHSFILREYTIEYSFPKEKGVKHKLLSTPDEIRSFKLPVGVAQIRAGRFGWPWIEAITPLDVKVLPKADR
jgi:hypothetical protein